ncbi:MAG TPA: HPr kinase/phosphatase C-terminal domain-containing protein [Rhizomicrobium sp.]|nr:HPr kinase/phosphatase C-terminal domain-containing protein [Rhizomicrobium sp.]
MTRVGTNVYATCVLLGRAGAALGAPGTAGVLLFGKSGSGKSDLALRLMVLGAKLVSDDRTELFVESGKLCARAPKPIKGLIEARGVGIVALPHAAKARVALAVSLELPRSRLPLREFYKAPFDLSRPVPLIRLAPFEASTPAKIVVAAAAFEKNLFRESIRS